MNKNIRGKEIGPKWVQDVAANYEKHGYPHAKWQEFALACFKEGYRVWLYEARKTVSKYLTVLNPNTGKKFLVRFSNHKPIKHLEVKGTCDFFVGHTHLGVTHTGQAIAATREALGKGNVEQLTGFTDLTKAEA